LFDWENTRRKMEITMNFGVNTGVTIITNLSNRIVVGCKETVDNMYVNILEICGQQKITDFYRFEN